jgi:transposase
MSEAKMRRAPEIGLTADERKKLTQMARGRRTQARLIERAQIVLQAAEGKENREIAKGLGIMPKTVTRWRTRFSIMRVAGIEKDLPRGGRPPTQRRQLESRIITKTTQETPANATHWSTRSLAKELKTTQSLVWRVLVANGLKPHLERTFKVSNDPDFENKLIDVVGLYLNPPANALVLSADEKSQVQALDRTQPTLPLVKGRCGTRTHDYVRNGTTTLFAAIELGHGEVIAKCMPRHRHQEWIKFLQLIDETTPSELDLHLIADNYATHKHAKVKAWLKKHPRFHMHFIPTSSSWLNVIENFFGQLTGKRLRRGAFRSVKQLIDAIMSYVEAHNDEPKPIVWTATVQSILAKVGRARATLNKGPTA